jgi:hypothetical protein
MLLLLVLLISLAFALAGAYLLWQGGALAIGGAAALITAFLGWLTARKLHREGYRIVPLGNKPGSRLPSVCLASA